jgi:glycosyltransferase involved in cell wall biosynthesis
MAGLFVRDQARALAQARPGWSVTVAGWGWHDGALDLRDAGASWRALRWRWRARPGAVEGASSPAAVITPRLSWTLALAGGGVRGLLSASRANLRTIEQRTGRVDCIHAHVGFPAGWIAARLARECGARVLLTEHMGPFPFPALRDREGAPVPRLRQAFTQADGVLAVSRALAAQIRAAGLPCHGVVPNVVDVARFQPRPAPPREPFVFFALGSLVPGKGFDVLLQALARMHRQPVHLVLGGEGPEAGTLRALAQRLGVQDRVDFIGAVAPEAVPALHAASHALVLPSHAETFGVVLIEALASGRPVVATRCGGPEDIVRAGNGLLVPPGDAAALAVALDDMIATHAAYDPQALHDDAASRYGPAVVGETLARWIERLTAMPVGQHIAAEVPA